MNAVYRIVWNTTHRTWVVASELAKGHKKPSQSRRTVMASLAASAALFAGGLLVTHEACAQDAVAIGTNAAASGSNSVAVGSGANADNASVALGWGATGQGGFATALGTFASAKYQATALGEMSSAQGSSSVALGFMSSAKQQSDMALGTQATADGGSAIAMGFNSKATGNHAFAGAANSMATGTDSVALGFMAKATAANSVALGANSTTSANLSKPAYNPGNGSVAGAPVGEVSVGKLGAERRMTNVAAGADDTDAVNVSQLKVVAKSSSDLSDRAVKYDTNSDGTPNYNSVTMGGTTYDATTKSGGTRIKNVARGIDDGDAVNVQQLKDVGLIDSNGSTLDAVVYDPGSNHASVTLGGLSASAPVVLRNVAAGVAETDAVNVSQLNQLKGQVNNIDARVTTMENGTGGTAQAPRPESSTVIEQTTVAPANTASTAQLQGVTSALGGGSTIDASGNVVAPNYNIAGSSYNNVGDALHGLDTKLDDNFNKLNGSIAKVNRQANRGIAAASAVQSAAPYVPGKVAINAGVAGYRGEAALGVGISRWNNSGKVNFNAGLSTARGDVPVFRVGVGMVLGE